MDIATDRVATAAKNHNKAWGRPGDTTLTTDIYSKGAQLLVQGSEFGGFINDLHQGRDVFDELLASERS